MAKKKPPMPSLSPETEQWRIIPDQKDNPWCIALPNNAYQDQITKIVIGAGITKLGSCAFLWCKNVSAVEFEGRQPVEGDRLNGFPLYG